MIPENQETDSVSAESTATTHVAADTDDVPPKTVPPRFPPARLPRKVAVPAGLTVALLEELEDKPIHEIRNFFRQFNCDRDLRVANHFLDAWGKHYELVRSTGVHLNASVMLIAHIMEIEDILSDLQSRCEEQEIRTTSC